MRVTNTCISMHASIPSFPNLQIKAFNRIVTSHFSPWKSYRDPTIEEGARVTHLSHARLAECRCGKHVPHSAHNSSTAHRSPPLPRRKSSSWLSWKQKRWITQALEEEQVTCSSMLCNVRVEWECDIRLKPNLLCVFGPIRCIRILWLPRVK